MAISSKATKALRQSSTNNAKLIKHLKRFSKRFVVAGITDNETHPAANMTYAQLMDLQENGYVTSPLSKYPNRVVPARPVLKIARIQNDKKWRKSLTQYVYEELDGKRQLDSAYAKLGEEMVEDIREVMLGNDLVANSDLTVSLKGGDDPLIESGALYDKIDSEVKRGKGRYK